MRIAIGSLMQETNTFVPFRTDVETFEAYYLRHRVKILFWDTSGLVLVWKQLQHGAFRWPPVMDGALRLSAVELAALFDGLDWTRVQAAPRIPTPTVAA